MKPFIFQHWHAWTYADKPGRVMLSDENMKTLRQFDSLDAAVNWLYLDGQKDAARALNAHANNERKPFGTLRTECGHGRATYHPEWDAVQPWATYIDGTAGRHVASVEAAAQYFAAKGMYLKQDKG